MISEELITHDSYFRLKSDNQTEVSKAKLIIHHSSLIFIIHYFRRVEQVKTKFQRLLFLHRVAFICNVFFVFCMVIRYSHADASIPQPIVELATILGWIFSPAINLICMVVSFIAVLKKGKGLYVPLWIIASNFIFFVIEIFYFFLS